MDEVLELEKSDQLEAAATRAGELGRFADAARLWERACRYSDAARAALLAGDAARAVELAARAGDAATEATAIAELVKDPERARLTAEKLSDLGRPLSGARVLAALGDDLKAAEGFERAAAWVEAARAHQRTSDPRRAARCLETAIDSDGSNTAARLMLGTLLESHGKYEPALRALQRIPETAPERDLALPILHRAFSALGMNDAARDVASEMERHGITPGENPAPRVSAESDGAVLFGRYRVIAEVARTPTARVLRAKDELGGEEVAIKLFSAASLSDAGRDALKRFEREALVLGQLSHPAIVPLRAFLPEAPAVVLAWMAGGSLADLLSAGTISPARAVEVACTVLTALSEAHRRGILHRDIKPANVLFDAGGAPHLADFGTAHVSDAAATVTSGVIGTLAYMAPEQREGRPANVKSDIYGVGALLVHALSGAPPATKLPFLSSELSARHREIVAILCASEAERPESALAARDLLRSLSWPTDAPAPRPSESKPVTPSAALGPRLQPIAGPRHRDLLLNREILLLEASGATLARAAGFARADHPGLAAVLKLDRETKSLWIDAVAGPSLDRALTDDERAFVAEALGALHRAGQVHGAVDREHVALEGGRAVLRFPLAPASGTQDDDLALCAKL